MKKRGRQINIKINLTNRWLYTLIALGILIVAGVGVYAAVYVNSVTKTGHDLSELQTCGANQTLRMNSAGNAWTCSTVAVALEPEMITVSKGYTSDASGTAYCPSGKKVVGGGCWCGSSATLGSSRPYSASLTGWYCHCKGSGALEIYAICAMV